MPTLQDMIAAIQAQRSRGLNPTVTNNYSGGDPQQLSSDAFISSPLASQLAGFLGGNARQENFSGPFTLNMPYNYFGNTGVDLAQVANRLSRAGDPNAVLREVQQEISNSAQERSTPWAGLQQEDPNSLAARAAFYRNQGNQIQQSGGVNNWQRQQQDMMQRQQQDSNRYGSLLSNMFGNGGDVAARMYGVGQQQPAPMVNDIMRYIRPSTQPVSAGWENETRGSVYGETFPGSRVEQMQPSMGYNMQQFNPSQSSGIMATDAERAAQQAANPQLMGQLQQWFNQMPGGNQPSPQFNLGALTGFGNSLSNMMNSSPWGGGQTTQMPYTPGYSPFAGGEQLQSPNSLASIFGASPSRAQSRIPYPQSNPASYNMQPLSSPFAFRGSSSR